jgi:hypothetical protein
MLQVVLGCFEADSDRFGPVLNVILSHFMLVSGRFGALSVHFGALSDCLGSFRDHFVLFSDHFVFVSGHVRAICVPFLTSTGCFRLFMAILGLFWVVLGPF